MHSFAVLAGGGPNHLVSGKLSGHCEISPKDKFLSGTRLPVFSSFQSGAPGKMAVSRYPLFL